MVNQNVDTYKGSAPTPRDRRRIVDESGRDAILFDAGSSEANKIKLWDLVDHTWTSPLEKSMAMEHYLAKVVFKCSCCTEASLYEGHIEQHLVRIKTNYESHRDAELHQGIGEGGQINLTCTGCGTPMSMRKNQGTKHIERICSDYDAHVKAGTIDVLLTHKYATSPSVSMPEQVTNTVIFKGEQPEVDRVSRSVDDRTRKRRRRKRRSR